jgi:soluble lytic murein transglycosylase-like protein
MSTIVKTAEVDRAIAAERYAIQQAQLQEIVDRLDDQKEQITDLNSRLDKMQTTTRESTGFIARDIPLSIELQEHTYQVGEQYGVPGDILIAIMAHESGYQLDAVHHNKNGTTDLGLCQINSVNHPWLLADHDLDVAKPRDNIEAAAVILSGSLEKYTPEEALAAYAEGEGGMLAGRGE